MDEIKQRKMMQEEIEKYMQRSQFKESKIPKHEHDGMDTQRIRENNLIPADNFVSHLVMGTDGSEVFTISKVPNFSLLTFYGVATNGAYDPTPAYNEKASIVGEARVGNLYNIDTISGTDIYSLGPYKDPTTGIPVNFYQACTSTYLNIADETKLFAYASAAAFAAVYDGTGEVISASITDIKETSIEITVTVTASWWINGFFFLS